MTDITPSPTASPAPIAALASPAPTAEAEAPQARSAVTFEVLPLSRELRETLAEIGYLNPTPVQLAVWEPATRGNDAVVQARTGTGKTAAFGLPIVDHLVRRSMAQVQVLALTPTRELALQVSREIERLGKRKNVKVTAIYGGAPMQRQIDEIADGAQVIVGTPGRVLDHLRRGTLDPKHIRLLVLDEADEMLSMGFEREVTAILDSLPKDRQTLLFSATLPPDIERMAKKLRKPEYVTLSGDHVGALSIEHFVYFVPGDKLAALTRVIEVENPEGAVVFCNTKDETERVAQTLARQGYDADWLNGDLPQNDREKVMAKTREGRLRFLVATDVAARGIDISHLTHVINFDYPQDSESYVHRTGRTGRAGRTGTAISLITPHDVGGLYLLRLTYKIRPIEKQIPSEGEMRTRAEADMVSMMAEAFASRGAHPDDLALARRLLTHEQFDVIVAGLLRDHLGARPDAQRDATAARKATRVPPKPEMPRPQARPVTMGDSPRPPAQPPFKPQSATMGDSPRPPAQSGPLGETPSTPAQLGTTGETPRPNAVEAPVARPPVARPPVARPPVARPPLSEAAPAKAAETRPGEVKAAEPVLAAAPVSAPAAEQAPATMEPLAAPNPGALQAPGSVPVSAPAAAPASMTARNDERPLRSDNERRGDQPRDDRRERRPRSGFEQREGGPRSESDRGQRGGFEGRGGEGGPRGRGRDRAPEPRRPHPGESHTPVSAATGTHGGDSTVVPTRHADFTTWQPPAEEGDDEPILGLEGRGRRRPGDSRAPFEGRPLEGAPAIESAPVFEARPAAPAPAAEPAAVAEADLDLAEIYVNIGRREGARASDFQRVLTERAGIDKANVRRIRVRERNAFVSVRRQDLTAAVAALSGATIAGKVASAEQARERGDEPGVEPMRNVGGEDTLPGSATAGELPAVVVVAPAAAPTAPAVDDAATSDAVPAAPTGRSGG